jgi:hypothetical protein
MPTVQELDGNVETIAAWWEPVNCDRVEVALKSKFGMPSVSSWRGRNGFGIAISGKVWTWRRKNRDIIEWTRPSPEDWPNCRLYASTFKWRSRPKEKDHL